MSGVRVLVGTRKGAFALTSDGKRKRWKVSGPHFAGWEIYHVKGSPVDPNRLFASQTSAWFGQIIQRSDDAHSIRGSSNASGISNRRLLTRIPFTPEWKTPRCSAQLTAASRGMSYRGCANTTRDQSGSRARVGCVCTRFFSIRAIPNECTSPSRPRARSALMTEAKRGDQSTAACTRNTFRIRMQRSATASIASQCTHRVRARCSCRSIGT